MQWELSLHGTWDFKLEDNVCNCDREDWKDWTFIDQIKIPGILQASGYGNDIDEHTPWVSSLHDRLWYQREEYKTDFDETLIPFLCQPPKHFLGKAWYQKSFLIPKDCSEKEFVFRIECVKWRTRVWIDKTYLSSCEGLCTPHKFSLGRLNEGEHIITVCIDNSLIYPYRPDGHMVSDALGATWNGMVGEVSIKSVPNVYLGDVKIYPNIDTKIVDIKIQIINNDNIERLIVVHMNKNKKEFLVKSGKNTLPYQVQYAKHTPLWDEYTPNLQSIEVILEYEDRKEEKKVPFGFRKIKVKDGLFFLNNRPTYFRGTHSGGDFPLTGYPSTDESEWRRIFLICKDWGLNYIRFHSFCPPKAAFIAADEVGIYLQIECGMWNTFNEGNHMDEVLWEETLKILNEYGNHPSFVMLSPTNEPDGKWFHPLTSWVSKCKEEDDRRIYTAQSGWFYPMEPDKIHGTDYVYFHRSGYGLQPGGTIRNFKGWHGADYRLSVHGIQYPVISHELGQWCSYPDFDVIDKFTGYLRPSNFIAFRENAKRRGVLSQNKEFAYCSGKVKGLFYKEEIEANLRTPHLYGFELLDLHDYIGQGSAFVGLLDPFWDEKGFITKEEFKCFCNETVPLLRISKRVFTNDELIDYPLEICHFGKEDIKDANIDWQVKDEEGNILKEGEFHKEKIPIGKGYSVGSIQFSLENLSVPAAYEIIVGIRGTTIENSWKIWLYETYTQSTISEGANYKNIEECLNVVSFSYSSDMEDVILTDSLTSAITYLKDGKKVIYHPKKEHHRLDSVPLSFKTSFWNAQMGPSYSRGMGVVIDSTHKALSLFPTKDYAEWQWSEIMAGAYGLNMDQLPKELKPIVQPIDDWNRNYRLSMVSECKVGAGSLLIVTADLEYDLENKPVKRQLMKSLISYACSNDFNPTVVVTEKMLYDSFFSRRIMKSYGVHVDEEFIDILDGEPNTFYRKDNAYPLTIHMETKKEAYIKGMIYMPRQNEREHKGDIKGIRIEAYFNHEYRIVYEGELLTSFDPKEMLFHLPVRTKQVRITALYGFSGNNVSEFYSDRNGWHQRVMDYEDKSVAIGDLLFLPVEKNFDEESSLEDRPQIILNSSTKEIDY